jgi:hypothetical protein
MNLMTEQKPLISGFGPRTTAEEALAGRDLRGKVTIVTGGHTAAAEALWILSEKLAPILAGSIT